MAWGKFYTFQATGLSQTKTSLGVLLCTAQGQFLGVRYHLKPPQNLRVPKGRKLLAKGKNAKAD